jgi:CRISPR-associated protein Cas5t
MMYTYGFSVTLTAETASFRDPGGQLYHETLPLPPVSTIIGIAGSALGFPFPRVWKFFEDNHLGVGVRDISTELRKNSAGKGLDLWKYQKIVSKEVKSDILKREFLFRPGYRLFYSGANREVIETLRKAFLSPAWALTLGTSDDLTFIKEVSPIENVQEVPGGSVDLSYRLIPGDQSDNYSFNWNLIMQEPVAVSLALPMVKNLPVGFVFGEQGERKGAKYQPFTFLAKFHSLKNPCPAYFVGQEIIPLFSLAKG